MLEEQAPLAYAAARPLDDPGSPCRIERTPDGLFITIPPPKLWVLLAGPVVGLCLASAPLMFITSVLYVQFRRIRGLPDFGCAFFPLAILACIMMYNVLRLVRAARFGRKSICISVTPRALIVERGQERDVPQSLTMGKWISIRVRASAPTMTLGRLVDFHIVGADGIIDLNFYTRQWKIGQEIELAIRQQIREYTSGGIASGESGPAQAAS